MTIGLLETFTDLLKNYQGQLKSSLYISLLFSNFMPKQSTHVAGCTALFCLRKIYWSNITNNSYLMSPSPPLPPQSVLFSSVSFPTLMSVWGGDTLNTLPLWQKTALRKNTSLIMCLSLYDSYINSTVKLFRCKNQPNFRFSDTTA